MKKSSSNWNVECKPSGREGYIFYHEGTQEIPFYWEYGGGDVIAIVRFVEPDKFAIERRREILERVAQELIRQQAPASRSEIDEQNLSIYIREGIDG
jgi:hypothetical protein